MSIGSTVVDPHAGPVVPVGLGTLYAPAAVVAVVRTPGGTGRLRGVAARTRPAGAGPRLEPRSATGRPDSMERT